MADCGAAGKGATGVGDAAGPERQIQLGKHTERFFRRFGPLLCFALPQEATYPVWSKLHHASIAPSGQTILNQFLQDRRTQRAPEVVTSLAPVEASAAYAAALAFK